MARLNLEQFKQNANKIIQEKSTQGLFSESQNKLLTLELDLLHDNPFRIKLNNHNIEKLSDSLDSFSQLEPITVAKQQNGYIILNGHARVAALGANRVESALCVVISAKESDLAYFPYLLNLNSALDNFEIAYYLDRLLAHGEKPKTIQKKLGLKTTDYPSYNFEYNLFDVLKNNELISYEYLLDISKIKDEALRDETLDHIIQKLISKNEIENYLTKIKEESLGSKFAIKTNGVKIKKNKFKSTIDLDERELSFEKIRQVYDFIDSIQ